MRKLLERFVDRFRKPNILVIGDGEVMMSHGTLHGFPTVGISRLPDDIIAGKPGEVIAGSEASRYMKRHGTFLMFTSGSGAVQMLDTIKRAVDLVAEEKGICPDCAGSGESGPDQVCMSCDGDGSNNKED